MQINFDKARKLINELEAKLNDTSVHTATARKALDEWIQSGEGDLRRKGASALKQVRKRAESFSKALSKLEQNLALSLDKKQIEERGKKSPKKTTAKKSAKTPSKKSTTVAKKKSPSKSAGKKVASKKAASSKPGS